MYVSDKRKDMKNVGFFPRDNLFSVKSNFNSSFDFA